MIVRRAEASLRRLMGQFPCVAITGPRQVGKTTLARDVVDSLGVGAVYLDLELDRDRATLADPDLYFTEHPDQLIVLDEIHQMPEVFRTLRGHIDQRRRAGRRTGQFLVLGSASMDLLRQSSESLAGRIAYLELTPLLASEIDDVDTLWVRGGFPDSFLAASEADSFEWREQFIRTYLQRDLSLLGPRVPAETMWRFWQMLAHSQGQMLNAARLATNLGLSGQTVARYLDTLADLLLVRRLRPWAGNAEKRLVRSPKVYVRDSGVTHALLQIRDRETLLGHPVVGASWEGFVIENLLMTLDRLEAYFYRTSNGAELDLVLQFGREIWAIEVKRSLSHPQPSKGFAYAAEDVKATRRIVIYPGTEKFKLDKKTEVMPLRAIVAELRGK
ncbi:MAG: ATP-binding protein [Bryobacteraceae bacterium]|nr:ATP-binding protein [Bryobacteraceae bacterium]